MKLITIIAILLITGRPCLSQESYTLPNVNGLSFPLFLDRSMRNNLDNKLDTLGIDGLCWIKFKVSSNGNITHLEISPGTNPALSKLLRETMLISDGLWTFRNEKEWFILPFKYTLQKKGKSESSMLIANELNDFFQGTTNSQITYTFLPMQEFISPFDRGLESKLKIKNDSN